MDKKKKPFDVTASSLVDLKAELYRKQEEFKQEKLVKDAGVPLKPKPINKKPGIWSKPNEGVAARAQKDVEQMSEEKKTLDEAKRKLEEKAKLYEQMTKGDFPDEETESLFLVDFTQKIIDQKKEVQAQCVKEAAERSRDMNGEESSEADTPLPPPGNPDEEWVDYVDGLGRSRRCMKKDLPGFMQMDRDLQGKRSGPEEKTLLSEDMRRELQRREWEREEEEAMNRPVGPVHYEDIREKEARELGVGYFAFAQDQALRTKQRETLDMLRDQTMDQRTKREKLKQKRKALLDARLAKVRQRKMKKINLDGTEEELAVEDKEGEEELIGPIAEPKQDSEEPSSVSTHKKTEVEIQERKDTKTGVPHVREWDRGKAFSFGHWSSKRREERDAEFAPPTEYFSDYMKPSQGMNWNRSKQTYPFQGRHAQNSESRDNIGPMASSQSESQSQTSAPQQSLDELLSYYKHST
uniref:Coiled-coil domain containing 174 n=1 Tax=Lepisosteus oculatus TaxID=7918 RepID=W5MZ66_LEPOC|nr:PREDICTED: coiled-coil domain-containing protein 174 [Lepisosteus oculatus]